MRAYGVRIPVVLMAMAGALLLLFGAQFIYNRQAVQQPLVSISHSMPAVQHVTLENSPSGLQVDVQLGLVPNLRETYLALQNQVNAALSGQHYQINLTDNHTPQLLDDFYQMNGVLEQGLATGQFVAMEQQVQAIGTREGLSQVSAIVDEHYVYVELVQGKNYLYELLPRQSVQAAAATGGA
ncbi:MAG TPA: hypothetical protein VNM16_07420 [Bacillota bacterium]|nr:hypothetical protein [Bacillota bacterium]